VDITTVNSILDIIITMETIIILDMDKTCKYNCKNSAENRTQTHEQWSETRLQNHWTIITHGLEH